jgi:cytoskeleton protein RodZ
MSDGDELAVTEDRASIDPAALSFGPRLAHARETLSLSVNDIAARLRLSPKQVMAIESENLEALPGPAFLRGFVRNYAKEVRLDPVPLIDALNRMLEPATTVELPAQERSPLIHAAERERFSRAFVITAAVGALLIFAAVGWFSNSRSRPDTSRVGSQGATALVATLNAPALTASAAAAKAPEQPEASSSVAGLNTAPPRPAAGNEAPAPVSSAAIEPTALHLSFREISWVEVTQEDGTVLMSQNNPAGTEQVVRGKPPYRVVIGNASTVSLAYGGKTIDLKPLTSADNVARLTVH